MYKLNNYLRHENKVNENKVLSYCEALSYSCETIKQQKMFSIMSNQQTHYHFKLDFQKCTNIQE